MKRQSSIFLALAAALALLPGCGDDDDAYDADVGVDVEEAGEPLIGEEMDRPVGTFEIGEEGAVDIEDEGDDDGAELVEDTLGAAGL